MSKRVLIVADAKSWHDVWFNELGAHAGPDGEVALVSAISATEARDLFADNPGFSAFVIAACSDDAPITRSLAPLVSMLAGNSPAPIIAVGEKEQRQPLVRAGCTFESTMYALPATLLEIIGA